jgi:hypothetical protein
MPDKWMSIAAAALTLNVHPRTIERRIASSKIESRRADDGQLLVLINAPDESPTNSTSQTEAFETVKELAQDQVSIATGSASALVKFAQADAERARTELDIARRDAGHARHHAIFAWSAVAVMTVAICVAVGWTSYKVTRSADDIRTLNERANATEKEAAKLRDQRDEALAQAQQAKLESARVAGHLEAVNSLPATRPTTRPTDFISRLAAAFTEP